MPIDPWLPRAAAMHPGRVALEAPEGELTSWQISGQFNIGNSPGEGIVIHDAGNVRFEDGIPTSLHGIHDTFGDEDPFCRALS